MRDSKCYNMHYASDFYLSLYFTLLYFGIKDSQSHLNNSDPFVTKTKISEVKTCEAILEFNNKNGYALTSTSRKYAMIIFYRYK